MFANRGQIYRGLSGTNVLIIKKEDAVVIADLMMGGNGTAAGTELDEIQLSAVGEAMNQMMGSATTSLSSMFDMRIDIDPPRVTQFDMGQEQLQTSLSDDYEQVVQIKFAMKIEDLLDSEIMQIIPLGAARDMVASLMGEGVDTEASASSVSKPEPTSFRTSRRGRTAPLGSDLSNTCFPVFPVANPGGQFGYQWNCRKGPGYGTAVAVCSLGSRTRGRTTAEYRSYPGRSSGYLS